MNELERQAKKVLDQSAEQLDSATLSRLKQARQRALAEADKRRGFFPGWLPAGNVARYSFASIAAVAVLSAVLLSQTGRNLPGTGNGSGDNTVSDLEIVATRDKLEMYEQLDFYQWMAEENNHAS